jgi:ketosteroid isomerase-like protein
MKIKLIGLLVIIAVLIATDARSSPQGTSSLENKTWKRPRRAKTESMKAYGKSYGGQIIPYSLTDLLSLKSSRGIDNIHLRSIILLYCLKGGSKMPDVEIANIMRDFVKVMAEGDVEKTLSFFTKDAVYVCPNGTFKGEDELKRLMTVQSQTIKDMKVNETGNGIIVEGNKAFFEHVISGMSQGKRAEVLAMCAYEFDGDKITKVRSTYDRLKMAQQVAPGWFAKRMINSIINKFEEGLH